MNLNHANGILPIILRTHPPCWKASHAWHNKLPTRATNTRRGYRTHSRFHIRNGCHVLAARNGQPMGGLLGPDRTHVPQAIDRLLLFLPGDVAILGDRGGAVKPGRAAGVHGLPNNVWSGREKHGGLLLT